MQAGGPGALEPMPIRTVGPITSPDPQECAKAATAAPVLDQLRQLWEFCTPPGRQLAQKGTLWPADARHLVELLGTGDVPDGQGARWPPAPAAASRCGCGVWPIRPTPPPWVSP